MGETKYTFRTSEVVANDITKLNPKLRTGCGKRTGSTKNARAHLTIRIAAISNVFFFTCSV